MKEFRTWQEYLKWLHEQLPCFTQALARSRETSSLNHRLRRQILGKTAVPDLGGTASALSRIDSALLQTSTALTRLEVLNSRLEELRKRQESGSKGEDTAEIYREVGKLRWEWKHLEGERKVQECQLTALKAQKATAELQIEAISAQTKDLEAEIGKVHTDRASEIRCLERETARTDTHSALLTAEARRLAALATAADSQLADLKAEIALQSDATSSVSQETAVLEAQLAALRSQATRLEAETCSCQRASDNSTRKNVSLLLQAEAASESCRKYKAALTKQVAELELQETSIEEMPYRIQCIERDYGRRRKLLAAYFRKRCVMLAWRCRTVEVRQVRCTLERLRREEEQWAEEVRREAEAQKRKEKTKKQPKKRSKKSSLPAKLASRVGSDLPPVDLDNLLTSFARMDR